MLTIDVITKVVEFVTRVIELMILVGPGLWSRWKNRAAGRPPGDDSTPPPPS